MTVKNATPEQLLAQQPASLCGWFGDPLQPGDAAALLDRTRRKLRADLAAGRDVSQLQVLERLCHAWLDSEPEQTGEQLAAAARTDHARGLALLVEGQLLCARKLQGAMDYLERGFHHAAGLLPPADYFALVRRHERLAFLPFSDRPAEPLPLPALLKEADVVARLRRGERLIDIKPHRDTVG